MDFAITPSSVDGGSDGWDVVYLLAVRGAECPLRLAGFGHRAHAEVFLDDLLTGTASPHQDYG
jgi:hypothetical protein